MQYFKKGAAVFLLVWISVSATFQKCGGINANFCVALQRFACSNRRFSGRLVGVGIRGVPKSFRSSELVLFLAFDF